MNSLNKINMYENLLKFQFKVRLYFVEAHTVALIPTHQKTIRNFNYNLLWHIAAFKSVSYRTGCRECVIWLCIVKNERNH